MGRGREWGRDTQCKNEKDELRQRSKRQEKGKKEKANIQKTFYLNLSLSVTLPLSLPLLSPDVC